jgi:hypothetical protein
MSVCCSIVAAGVRLSAGNSSSALVSGFSKVLPAPKGKKIFEWHHGRGCYKSPVAQCTFLPCASVKGVRQLRHVLS